MVTDPSSFLVTESDVVILDEAVVTAPTLGANVEEYDYKNIHFSMWDLGGQDQVRSTVCGRPAFQPWRGCVSGCL